MFIVADVASLTNDIIYTCDDVAERFCLPTLKLEDRGIKTEFCGILTSKIVMRKSALKNGTIPPKSEWLASLKQLSSI